MEIKILRNIHTNRLVLVDKRTSQAFVSLGKGEKIYEYLINNCLEEIEDFKPTS